MDPLNLAGWYTFAHAATERVVSSGQSDVASIELKPDSPTLVRSMFHLLLLLQVVTRDL